MNKFIKDTDGSTLVEVLTATVILALLAVMLSTVIRSGGSVFARGDKIRSEGGDIAAQVEYQDGEGSDSQVIKIVREDDGSVLGTFPAYQYVYTNQADKADTDPDVQYAVIDTDKKQGSSDLSAAEASAQALYEWCENMLDEVCALAETKTGNNDVKYSDAFMEWMQTQIDNHVGDYNGLQNAINAGKLGSTTRIQFNWANMCRATSYLYGNGTWPQISGDMLTEYDISGEKDDNFGTSLYVRPMFYAERDNSGKKSRENTSVIILTSSYSSCVGDRADYLDTTSGSFNKMIYDPGSGHYYRMPRYSGAATPYTMKQPLQCVNTATINMIVPANMTEEYNADGKLIYVTTTTKNYSGATLEAVPRNDVGILGFVTDPSNGYVEMTDD